MVNVCYLTEGFGNENKIRKEMPPGVWCSCHQSPRPRGTAVGHSGLGLGTLGGGLELRVLLPLVCASDLYT